METYEEQIFPLFEEESLCSAQECLASQAPWPGSDEAAKMTVGSGRQLSMLLDVSSPLGAFSKILLESSLWTSSEEFCYVWNRLDTRFALSAFQLTPLGQSTEDNGCSLWQTPRNEGFDAGKHNGKADSLHSQAKEPKLWPTPVVNDARNGRNETANRNNPNSRHHVGTTLSDAVRLWPTPRASDYNGSGPEGSKNHEHMSEKQYLCAVVADSTSGSLNPRFVEQLMGFEIDHTALKPSATPLSRSKRSPFSRPLPKLKHV